MPEYTTTSIVHTLRIPTSEQYAYIEIQFIGTGEEALEEYRRLTTLVKAENGGIEKKKFDEIIDLMIQREKIYEDPGILEGMNTAQKYIFDCVRKSLGRIDYKNR